jgi:Kef-type K+ transport system membrane component KefB
MENAEVARLLLAVAVLFATAHLGANLFRLLKLPRVMGEMFGGLLLGPTVLGYFAPGAYQYVFQAWPSQTTLLAAFQTLGLIFLMLVSGFELGVPLEGKDRRLGLALFVGSTFLPFVAGWMAPSLFDLGHLLGPRGNLLSLRLIIGVAVAITSIPILSKIFVDLGILDSRFARLVISVAVFHDIILWVAVTVAMATAGSASAQLSSASAEMGIALAFLLFGRYLAPPLIRRLAGPVLRLTGRNSLSAHTTAVLVVFFLFVLLARALGVSEVFGALLAGAAIGKLDDEKFEQARTHIRSFALSFFVAIYFAMAGWKLDLVSQLDLGLLAAFLLLSSACQILVAFLTARLMGQTSLSGLNLAMALNARGGPGIVLATLAFDAGLIAERLFVVLVLTAMLTSMAAGWWFRFVLRRGWPLLT